MSSHYSIGEEIAHAVTHGLGILLSIGGHLLIRSFEVAVPEKNDQDHA